MASISAATKRFELLRAQLKADEAGQTLLDFFKAQILDADSVRELGVASVTHGSSSSSFFSPQTFGSLTVDERAEILERFYTICDTAVSALGGSPTNDDVRVQMLEDDYFHGVTGYNVDLTCQAR